MKMTFNICHKVLRACALLTDTTGSRPILENVAIETSEIEDGVAIAVATNGAMLVAVRTPITELVWSEDADKAKLKEKPILIHNNFAGKVTRRTVIGYELNTDTTTTTSAMQTLGVVSAYWESKDSFTYPKWKQAVTPNKPPGAIAPIWTLSVSKVLKIYKAANILGVDNLVLHAPDGDTGVRIAHHKSGNIEFFGVLMPMRSDFGPEYPSWVANAKEQEPKP